MCRWSSDKLVVYSYSEVEGPGAEDQPSKRAVIMPPGASFGSMGTSARLRLLFRGTL